MKIYLKREEDLAVCKLEYNHKWFWTSCWKETKHLIGMDLEPDECVSFDLTATNIVRLGRASTKTETRFLTERWTRVFPFKSKKTQLGVLTAWGLGIFAVLGTRVFGFSLEEVSLGVYAVTAIVCVHILGHAITDGMANFGKGK